MMVHGNGGKEPHRDLTAFCKNTIERLPIGLFWSSVNDGLLLKCNGYLARLAGYETPEKCLSEHVDSVHFLNPEQHAKILAGLKKSGRIETEVQFRKRDGAVVWISYSAHTYADQGFVEGYICDITHRRRSEQALRDSETRFKLALKNGPIAVFTQDRELRYTWIYNPNADFDPESLIGKTDFDLISSIFPDELAKVIEIKKSVIMRGVSRRTEVRTTVQGKVFFFDLSVEPVYDPAGTVAGICCTSIDITERKAAEEKMRRSESMFSTLFEVQPVGIAVADFSSGRLLDVNQSWLEMTGYSQKLDVIGKISVEQWLQADRSKQVSIVDELRQKTRVRNREFTLTATSGERRSILLNASIIGMGGQQHAMIACVDITERKLLEAEQRKISELAAVNKELESFSYSVSHDLRGPLVWIRELANVLYEDYGATLDLQGQDYVNKIVKAADRMGELINDLLNLAKISRQESIPVRIDLSALARAIAGQLYLAEPGRNVEIAIIEGLQVYGDEKLITIALSNLIGNAWKYTSKTTDARIEFGAAEMDGETVFYMKDNGAGFDVTKARRLFTPFQRYHSEREFTGTGIGLAIVKKVIDRHAGRIWVKSEVGKGTVFYFTLSCKKARE